MTNYVKLDCTINKLVSSLLEAGIDPNTFKSELKDLLILIERGQYHRVSPLLTEAFNIISFDIPEKRFWREVTADDRVTFKISCDILGHNNTHKAYKSIW